MSENDLRDCLSTWTGKQPEIVTLQPDTLADVWKDISRVGHAIGREREAQALIAQAQARMAFIADEAADTVSKPTVACIEWIEPLMAAGNWMPELVEMAGGINLFGEAGQHSPWMTFAELVDADPDVIVILPCGYDIAETKANLPPLLQTPGFGDLKAVREGRVAITDGNQYFNRPGPRLVESLEIMAEILHPKTFDFGHRGVGWWMLGEL